MFVCVCVFPIKRLHEVFTEHSMAGSYVIISEKVNVAIHLDQVPLWGSTGPMFIDPLK